MADEARTEDRQNAPHIDPFAHKPQRASIVSDNDESRLEETGPHGSAGDRATVTRPALDDRESRDGSPNSEPKGDPPIGTAAIAQPERVDDPNSLLDESEAEGLRNRWEECQQRFVDEPRASVESADQLVAEVMQKVASQFVATREALEQQWGRGDSVSTEDLRQAMRRYRDFFNRLLAA